MVTFMWFKIQDHQVLLNIFVKPNAKRTALLKVNDNELQIALHAKPHHGEANKELILYLAELFRIPKSKIILKRGEGGRHKQIILPLMKTVKQFIDDPIKFIVIL